MHFLSTARLPKMLFVIVSISGEEHKEKSTGPRSREDSERSAELMRARRYL